MASLIILPIQRRHSLWPLDIQSPEQFYIMEAALSEWSRRMAQPVAGTLQLHCYHDAWLHERDIRKLLKSEHLLKSDDGEPMAWSSSTATESPPSHLQTIPANSGSMIVRYPWQFLEIAAQIVSALPKWLPGRTLQQQLGQLIVGQRCRILSGVVVEGIVVMGSECTVGPHCYLRGPVIMGHGCRVGQAVEIKNSIIGNQSAIPHLSYLGDSIIGNMVNIAAGCITANLRHDHQPIRSQIIDRQSSLVNSGRVKLGAIIGDRVRLGIGTHILPGRKIGANLQTYPHTVVHQDLH